MPLIRLEHLLCATHVPALRLQKDSFRPHPPGVYSLPLQPAPGAHLSLSQGRPRSARAISGMWWEVAGQWVWTLKPAQILALPPWASHLPSPSFSLQLTKSTSQSLQGPKEKMCTKCGVWYRPDGEVHWPSTSLWQFHEALEEQGAKGLSEPGLSPLLPSSLGWGVLSQPWSPTDCEPGESQRVSWPQRAPAQTWAQEIQTSTSYIHCYQNHAEFIVTKTSGTILLLSHFSRVRLCATP